MKDKELIEFIENELGEKLTSKQIAGLFSAAKAFKEDRLFNFIESESSEHLSQEQKANAVKAVKAFENDNHKINKEKIVLFHGKSSQSKGILKYAMTAVASVALCLTIALPIAMGKNKTIIKFIPETVKEIVYVDKPVEITVNEEKVRYSTNNILTLMYEPHLMGNAGMIVFKNEQVYKMGEAYLEIVREDSVYLSHIISGIEIMFDDIHGNQTFYNVDYRVRSYNEYDFMGYYDDFFATLETVHNNEAETLAGDKSFESKKILREDAIIKNAANYDVHAFISNDIPIFYCFRKETAQTFIYFANDGYEYCITLSEKTEILGMFPLTAEFIKDVFIYELFKNIK